MKIAAAAVTFMLLTGSAHAQINLWANDPTRDPAEEEKQREIDKAYKAKIQSMPANTAPATNDPWGSVRPSSQPASNQNKQQSNSKTR